MIRKLFTSADVMMKSYFNVATLLIIFFASNWTRETWIHIFHIRFDFAFNFVRSRNIDVNLAPFCKMGLKLGAWNFERSQWTKDILQFSNLAEFGYLIHLKNDNNWFLHFSLLQSPLKPFRRILTKIRKFKLIFRSLWTFGISNTSEVCIVGMQQNNFLWLIKVIKQRKFHLEFLL